ncbi:hypothetical protein ACFQNE_02050 [Gordonia phosphorivorans]|uniref:Tail terminator n=1 Tax=Gordonia phosphorivorans TaxID=1056982 RepID=A0ABV6H6V6_9ACTN
MSRPSSPVEPVDVVTPVRDWLRARLGEKFPDVRVELELPADWEFGDPPVLAIADDGGPLDQWPVCTRPTLRLTSYTTGRDTAIIRRALGLLLCSDVPPLASVLPGTAVIEARDSRTGADLASVTVRTRVRTAAI